MNGYKILSKIIDITNASVDADRRLINVVETLALIFSVPLCALFLWDPQQARLFLRYGNRTHPALPEGMSLAADEGPLGACAAQRVPIILDDASQPVLWAPRLPEDLVPFHFLAAFPVVDDISLYGVLGLFGDKPRPFTEEERSLLPVICRQLAGTIRRAQFSLQAKKRIAELTTLHSIGMAVSSILELGELLNQITLSSAKLLQADGCILRLLDEEGGALKVVSSFGLEQGALSLGPVQLGEDVAGIVALTGEPILLPDVKRSPYSFTKFPPFISSIVCVPLIFKSKTIGTLALFSDLQGGYPKKIFDEEDKDLLATMASQIAGAIENAIILQRAEILARDKESALRELSLLYKVSGSMLTTTKLDQLLRIILISVTLGNPRGFDRASLFLVDEKENVLQGMMGVGVRDRDEMDHWRQKLGGQDIFSPDWVFPEEMGKTPFDLRVRQARVSLDEEHSVLIRTIREKRAFNVEKAAADPAVNPKILSWFGSQAFASIPLIAKEKVIGVIAVDNLLSERPITAGDMGFVTLLANQAALAIENSRLYGNLQEMNTELLQTQGRLIQSEKLAALGEVVASITHEIRNPLVSIGGFARRLDRHFQEASPEKKYMRILIKEVNRLESILNETLSFSREPSTDFTPHPLNPIIEDALFILEGEIQERNISITKELARDLPPLLSDPQQVKQVFLNLFVNALQAMGRDGQLSVKTSVERRNEHEVLRAEVTDTGGGIRLEILDNIFNPFFTTKHDGTGLGLAIAHKIITQHRGEIEVINHPGVGATFLIRFPLPE